jgi:hypothetical protein
MRGAGEMATVRWQNGLPNLIRALQCRLHALLRREVDVNLFDLALFQGSEPVLRPFARLWHLDGRVTAR